MGFSQKVADEVLVRCRRHCCLCDVYAGSKMELHHIKQVAEGGEDTADNCIPLCLNCHAEVKAYNLLHPKGRKFTENELRGHRDKCYAKYNVSISDDVHLENIETSLMCWFTKYENVQVPKIIWGFSDVERMCPLLPGTIALIAGYTDAGKSIYARQIMLKNIMQFNTVLYFHMKESCDALLDNIIAAESAIKLSNLQRQLLTADEWKRVSDTLSRINFEYLKLVPFNMQPPMSEQILVAAERSNAQLIVIDDFNALGFRDNSSVEEFLYRLKGTVSKTGAVILILANISQRSPRIDKRPIRQDIQYESLYRMSDIVQFLYREEESYSNVSPCRVEVIVVKNHGSNVIATTDLVALPDIPLICSIGANTKSE